MAVGMVQGKEARAAMEWMLDRLSPALYRMHTRESLLEDVAQGHMQVWVYATTGGAKVVWITQIVKYPKGEALEVVLAAGDEMARGLDAGLELMEKFARGIGCRRLAITGRRAWLRLLERRGWRFLAITMVKELEPFPAERTEQAGVGHGRQL